MELFMKNRDFDKWLSTMNDSIATWKYYTDFEKVYKNAEKIKTEIYILNSLINSKNDNWRNITRNRFISRYFKIL